MNVEKIPLIKHLATAEEELPFNRNSARIREEQEPAMTW